MGQELVTLDTVEQNMKMLAPRFDAVLGNGTSLTSQRLIQTLLTSIERNPKLLRCTRQSLINGAMTFATLRLPIDGASGQGFLLPFKDTAQPVIGYKGYNTIAGRSGLTVNAGTVREGDHEWDYREGTGGFVRHKRMLDNTGKIIAFWAEASANDRPPLIAVLGIGEVNEIMQRSPAVKYKAETPWFDQKIGFPAMGEKSTRRRLARGMPWDVDEGRYLLAARMEEAYEEQGKNSYIDGKTVRVLGDETDREPSPAQTTTPSAAALTAPRLTDHEKQLRTAGDREAAKGMEALSIWWTTISRPDQRLLETYKEETLKPAALAAEPG